jgi:hypothetical protein
MKRTSLLWFYVKVPPFTVPPSIATASKAAIKAHHTALPHIACDYLYTPRQRVPYRMHHAIEIGV